MTLPTPDPHVRRASRAVLPPTRDGVGPSCVGLPRGTWHTITDFLVERFPAQGRATWLGRMEQGLVVDEFGAAVTEKRRYDAPLRVYYYRDCPAEALIPFDAPVLWRDAHLLVVDKPHFLPVLPSGRYLQETLLVRLKRALQIDTIVPIHRIDRDTAGLVMFSLQPASRDAYQGLFRQRTVHKVYEAVAPWREDLAFPLRRSSRITRAAHFMQQCEVPGPANASTTIDLMQRAGGLAHYRLRPTSGYRHQLRVHMAALGIPIVGDRLYPELLPPEESDYDRPLQLLARAISFTDPLSGAAREFQSQRRLALAT